MVRTRSQRTSIEIGGRAVPVTLRKNCRARRMVLRIDAARNGGEDGVFVTIPTSASFAAGLDWLNAKTFWVEEQLRSLAPRVSFANGAIVPVIGVEHIIRHTPAAGRGVWLETGEIHVSGRTEHIARRVLDWFKREARGEIMHRVSEKAGRLDRQPGRVTLRDTRSRWGSCAANGNLSFCWRLIMAPEFVLDYVVAHEVAHLQEANHKLAFWRSVAALTSDPDTARAWLRKYGEGLHRIG